MLESSSTISESESAILWKESPPLGVRHDCTVYEVLASDKAS